MKENEYKKEQKRKKAIDLWKDEFQTSDKCNTGIITTEKYLLRIFMEQKLIAEFKFTLC